MELKVLRYADNGKATLGMLFLDGQPFCFTLEDEFRAVKLSKETRIPEGKYEIKFRTEGTHNDEFKKKYGAKHFGMLWLQDVPNFQFILIHIGNTEKDTDGCLLVGVTADSSNFTIGGSTIAYEKLYPIVASALNKGEKVTIEYKKYE